MFRIALVILVVLAAAAPALAADLGAAAPPKQPVAYAPPAAGLSLRQGGDTIADAVPLALPSYGVTGTTAGYTDDYDEVCPYSGSTSPDVVYSLTVAQSEVIYIDLWGSAYDTKVYVYDADLQLIACNDDYYSNWVSYLENVPVEAGVTYYIVIDGYGGSAGQYVLNMGDMWIEEIPCPPGAQLEGEPPLVDGYEDACNGGCNSPQFGSPFGVIDHPFFCGVSGWYASADGAPYRDTDWFEITVPSGGVVEIIGDADYATYLFELAPTDCGSVAVAQSVTVGPWMEGEIIIAGEPGSTIWFWVGPTVYDGPVNEYDYVLYTNLQPPVATRTRSWSAVKALFDR